MFRYSNHRRHRVLAPGRRVDPQVEQMAAYEENDGGRLPLTWAQTRTMPITNLVRRRYPAVHTSLSQMGGFHLEPCTRFSYLP